MTVTAAHTRALARGRVRQIDWHHPEWWVVPLAGIAWLGLAGIAIARATGTTGSPEAAYSPLLVCAIAPVGGGSVAGAEVVPILSRVGEAALMVVAMMSVLLVPTLHRVGLSSVWGRRRRAPALVLVAFVATWLPVVLVLDATVAGAARAVGSAGAIAIATVLSLAWQANGRKWLAVRRCARITPLPVDGLRADVASLRLGSAVGRSCVVACGGYMLVAAAAGHGIVALAVLAGAQLSERMAPRPGPFVGATAVVAVGTVAGLAALAG